MFIVLFKYFFHYGQNNLSLSTTKRWMLLFRDGLVSGGQEEYNVEIVLNLK